MTFRTIGIDIDDAVYQRALLKAASENRMIDQVLSELLTAYAGPAPVPVTIPDPVIVAPSTQPDSYIVRSGDTLGSIARQIYGSARYYPNIQRANNIQDPRRIWVGQRLILPVIEGVTAATPAVTPPVVTPPPVTPPVSNPIAPTAVNKPKPPVQFVGSPNFNRRPQNEISAIVVHATANGSLEGVINWFNNPNAQVSAHYTIGKDGTIVQHVLDRDRAWHAGRSSWNGRASLNDWSIGIELVNWNNGQDPYPAAQHQANVTLIAYLVTQYGINPDLIRAHYDVSPGRKTDPRGYDMEGLRQEIATMLQSE